MAITMLLLQCGSSRTTLQARWGGEGTQVWVAEATVAAGQPVHDALVEVRLPPVAVPDGAVTGPVDRDALAVLPVLAGAVLQEGHLAPNALVDGLAAGERLVPVPVDPTWGIEPGVVVDVWTVEREGPPRLLAEGRTVQALQGEEGRTALLVLVGDEVADATAVLTRGALRLTLTPDTPDTPDRGG